MKISAITCYPVSLHGSYLFVVVDTDEGLCGLGEAGLSGRELAVVGAIEHFKPLLVGQDPGRIEHIWQTLSRGGFFPHDRVLGSAISAIDMALWDIKGKALGVPVYDLLGGRVRDRALCYCHLGDGLGPARLIEAAQAHIQQGYKVIRWAPPSEGDVFEPAKAIRKVVAEFQAVREAVGDEIEICIDIHTRLSPADAILLCREIAPLRPFFMEDPVRSESPQAFHLLRRKIDVPLAAGEQFASKWEFRELIDHDLIDYCRVDLSIAGGITEAKKIAGWCEGHYIDMATHCPLSEVMGTASLHLNLAVPNFGVQEHCPRGAALGEILRNAPEWEDGYLLAPAAPGLGIEFDRQAAARYPLRITELPHYYREDGSLTNW